MKKRVGIGALALAASFLFGGAGAQDDAALFSIHLDDETSLTVEDDVHRVVLRVKGRYLQNATLEAWLYENGEVCAHDVQHARGGKADFQIECELGNASSRQIAVTVDSKNLEDRDITLNGY